MGNCPLPDRPSRREIAHEQERSTTRAYLIQPWRPAEWSPHWKIGHLVNSSKFSITLSCPDSSRVPTLIFPVVPTQSQCPLNHALFLTRTAPLKST